MFWMQIHSQAKGISLIAVDICRLDMVLAHIGITKHNLGAPLLLIYRVAKSMCGAESISVMSSAEPACAITALCNDSELSRTGVVDGSLDICCASVAAFALVELPGNGGSLWFDFVHFAPLLPLHLTLDKSLPSPD